MSEDVKDVGLARRSARPGPAQLLQHYLIQRGYHHPVTKLAEDEKPGIGVYETPSPASLSHAILGSEPATPDQLKRIVERIQGLDNREYSSLLSALVRQRMRSEDVKVRIEPERPVELSPQAWARLIQHFAKPQAESKWRSMEEVARDRRLQEILQSLLCQLQAQQLLRVTEGVGRTERRPQRKRRKVSPPDDQSPLSEYLRRTEKFVDGAREMGGRDRPTLTYFAAPAHLRPIATDVHPHGTKLAVGLEKAEVEVFSVTGDESHRVIRAHQDTVTAVRFITGPDYEHIISCSLTGAVALLTPSKVWYEPHGAPATCLALPPHPSPTEPRPHQFFATADAHGSIHLYDLQRLSALRVLRRQRGGIDAIAFHPNQNLLGSGAEDKTVTVWSLKEPRPVFVLPEFSGEVEAVCFSADGILLGTGSEDRRVSVWDLRCWGRKPLHTRSGHHSKVAGIHFAPHRLIYTTMGGSKEGAVLDWWFGEGEGESVSESAGGAVLGSRWSSTHPDHLLLSGGTL